MDIEQILRRLTAAREIAGLSEGQAGKLVETTGERIRAIEANTVSITLEEFMHLCKVYGVSPEWVLTGSNPLFNSLSVKVALERTELRVAEQQKIIQVLEMVTFE